MTANEKRLIDANDLWHKTFICDEVAEVRKFIEQSPTVDAVEVVHGRWEKYQRFVICSNCDTGWPYYKNDTDRFRYCPNCGAKMDGGESNE